MVKHFPSTRLVVAEHFKFNKRDQELSESVTQYIMQLKNMAMSHMMQRKLFIEPDVTFNKACGVATSMECTAHQTNMLEPTAHTEVHDLAASTMARQTTARQQCKHCGRVGNRPTGKMPCLSADLFLMWQITSHNSYVS
ncbi:hypothetical protein PR048_019482 [Dryococelus australis]|uniref:Uncharacterized protein n=1 Tax=Dryococelus australis TaxID=614101 RepID=A0ABQ9H3K6_9NEOP|nr:hypothetical protein PR048_019482 [Dryococelus australis]